jgi:hypothetical protein
MERSILSIKLKDKVNSKYIRSKTNIIDALEFVLKQKWRWAGHIGRLTDDRWTNKVTKWPGPQGKRKVGKPITRWSKDIIATAGENWQIKAKDRERWKDMEEAYTRQGSLI